MNHHESNPFRKRWETCLGVHLTSLYFLNSCFCYDHFSNFPHLFLPFHLKNSKDLSLQLLGSLDLWRLVPDAISLSAIFQAFQQRQQLWPHALHLAVAATAVTSSEMMNGVVGVLGSAQQWQRAMMILNQMVESKVLLLGCGGGCKIVLGGGFKYFFIFIPIWGNDPIWLKPPTSVGWWRTDCLGWTECLGWKRVWWKEIFLWWSVCVLGFLA